MNLSSLISFYKFIGIMSGALLQLKEEFSLSCFEQEFVVSSLLIGATIGSILGGELVS